MPACPRGNTSYIFEASFGFRCLGFSVNESESPFLFSSFMSFKWFCTISSWSWKEFVCMKHGHGWFFSVTFITAWCRGKCWRGNCFVFYLFVSKYIFFSQFFFQIVSHFLQHLVTADSHPPHQQATRKVKVMATFTIQSTLFSIFSVRSDLHVMTVQNHTSLLAFAFPELKL